MKYTMKNILKKISIALLTLAVLLAPTIASANIAVGWQATSTTQKWIFPTPVNGFFQAIQAPYFIATSTATSSSFNGVGVGSTTPWGFLSVNGNGLAGPQFVVGSSTATNLVVTNGGNVGIATSSPSSLFSIGNVANFANGTSTLYGGFNLTSGCFSVLGACIGGASASLFTNSGASTYLSTGTNLGVGTTTPGATLAVVNSATTTSTLSVYGTQQSVIGTQIVTFTSSGTWVPPFGVASISVQVIGGGGGGGGQNNGGGGGGGSTLFGTSTVAVGGGGGSGANGGGGGGASTGGGAGGATAGGTTAGAGGGGGGLVTLNTTTILASYTITIGQGGVGGNASSGTGGAGFFAGAQSGGTSGGGSGGSTGAGSSVTAGTGNSTGGTITTGVIGAASSGGTFGAGGASGSGAAGGATAGANGSNFGAGGAGNAGAKGGNGAPGEVVITETFIQIPYPAISVANQQFVINGNTYTSPFVGIGSTSPFAELSSDAASGTPAFAVANTINGNKYTTEEFDLWGHKITGGSAPTCGTGCSSVVGDDQTFRAITGSGVTSVIVNFSHTYAFTPVCVSSDESGGTTVSDASSTPSTVTFNLSASLTSKSIGAICQISNNFTY